MISFTLIEERSNEHHPLIEVTFPDGSSEFLILRKYENLDGHFIGHLENEPSACVAMVNHPEHSELTIMSDRIGHSTMYKWKHNTTNGDVEVIPELFSSGESDIMIDPNPADEIELDKIEPNNVTTTEFVSVPVAAKLQIKVVLIISLILGGIFLFVRRTTVKYHLMHHHQISFEAYLVTNFKNKNLVSI